MGVPVVFNSDLFTLAREHRSYFFNDLLMVQRTGMCNLTLPGMALFVITERVGSARGLALG